MKTIGIIGYGFVGKAVANANSNSNLLINDPLLGTDSVPLNTIIEKSDWIYVCVPTAALADGSCDISILADTLCQLRDYTKLVICKSTALPSFYSNIEARAIAKTVYKFDIAHIPEFLTTANASDDYLNPSLIVIGGQYNVTEFIEKYVLSEDVANTTDATIVKMSIGDSAAVKYYANSFLATKVLFNNEFATWCSSQGVKWDAITSVLEKDSRLGDSHFKVPGPDGNVGYGGACFPKDVAAVLASANKSKINMDFLNAQYTINNKLRKELTNSK